MASAVIRVKRRIDEESYDKFVLNCKRLKTNDENNTNNIPSSLDKEDNTRTILKLAATVNTDDDISKHLDKLRKSDAEILATKVRKPASAIAKLREQFKSDSQNHRYKIVNCFRSIDNDGETIETSDSNKKTDITVVDVIKENVTHNEQTSQNIASVSDANTSSKFVYDLYLVDSGEQPTELNIDDYISIRPFDDLICQTNDETANDSDNDSEDSNDEANWQNDYPDTDEDFSIGEDDMRRAVEELNFGSDNNNLSSDDEDYANEPVVHFIDEADDENDYNYFKKYGRIKSNSNFYRPNQNRRMMADFDEDENQSDIDDDCNTSQTNSSIENVSPLVSSDENND